MNRRAVPPEPLDDDHLAALARALGSPTRLKIVRYLSQCTPHIGNEIVEATGLAQSTISEHIKALRDAGIVLFNEDDPPRTWYCINRAILNQMADTLAHLPVPFEGDEPVTFRPESLQP